MKMMMKTIAVVLIGGWFGGTAWAYEEIAVTDGGTLSGKVVLDGKVPMPKGYNLTTLPDAIYCGRISDGRGWRLLQPFNVGTNGEFRQVVVLLEDMAKESRSECTSRHGSKRSIAGSCRLSMWFEISTMWWW